MSASTDRVEQDDESDDEKETFDELQTDDFRFREEKTTFDTDFVREFDDQAEGFHAEAEDSLEEGASSFMPIGEVTDDGEPDQHDSVERQYPDLRLGCEDHTSYHCSSILDCSKSLQKLLNLSMKFCRT